MCTYSKQAFTSMKKKNTDCLIYCILSNGEVIKYHKFISVVVIELSFRCLNTGPEDRQGSLVIFRQELVILTDLKYPSLYVYIYI